MQWDQATRMQCSLSCRAPTVSSSLADRFGASVMDVCGHVVPNTEKTMLVVASHKETVREDRRSKSGQPDQDEYFSIGSTSTS